MPGKPPFAVYDLRCLTQDDIEELRIALQDRLIHCRSKLTDHDEASIELARRRGRVEALLNRVSYLRHDKSCITRGQAARAAHRDAISSTAARMRNGTNGAATEASEESEEDEA